MDTMRDAKPFHELMDELCAMLRDGFKSSDAMRNAMWDALKDVPFSEIKANAKRIMATATKDTPFPKPRDLRNRAPVIEGGPYEARRQAADAFAEQTWRELRARDPIAFEVEFRIARAARELAGMSTLDPGFDEWTREYQHWASVRYAPREAQESAVARFTSLQAGKEGPRASVQTGKP